MFLFNFFCFPSLEEILNDSSSLGFVLISSMRFAKDWKDAIKAFAMFALMPGI